MNRSEGEVGRLEILNHPAFCSGERRARRVFVYGFENPLFAGADRWMQPPGIGNPRLSSCKSAEADWVQVTVRD
jgi:hypothetical protein